MSVFHDESLWPARSPALGELFPRLQHVPELRLTIHDALDRRDAQSLGSLCATLRSVESLSVTEEGSSAREEDSLAVLLGHFPRLRLLRLTSASYNCADVGDAMMRTPAPRFAPSALELDALSDHWTMTWLQRMPWQNLTRLSIATETNVGVDNAIRLLSAAGANLRELLLVHFSDALASGKLPPIALGAAFAARSMLTPCTRQISDPCLSTACKSIPGCNGFVSGCFTRPVIPGLISETTRSPASCTHPGSFWHT